MNIKSLNILVKVMTFAAGAASGIAGTYIFLKKKYDKKLIEEVDKLDKYYMEKYGINDPVDKVVVKDSGTDMSKYRSTAPKEREKKGPSESSLVRGERIRASRLKNRERIDYTSFYKGSGKSEEEMVLETEHPKDDEAEDPEWEENHYAGLAMTEEISVPKKPKIIKAIDFGAEPGFRTQTLLYYQDDDTLVIEDDEDFDEEDAKDFSEWEDALGDALFRYGFKQDASPVIYVRNFQQMIDYEIEKVFGSYEEE